MVQIQYRIGYRFSPLTLFKKYKTENRTNLREMYMLIRVILKHRPITFVFSTDYLLLGNTLRGPLTIGLGLCDASFLIQSKIAVILDFPVTVECMVVESFHKLRGRSSQHLSFFLLLAAKKAFGEYTSFLYFCFSCDVKSLAGLFVPTPNMYSIQRIESDFG